MRARQENLRHRESERRLCRKLRVAASFKSFSAIDEAYDGTNGTSDSYNANTGSIIFDSTGSLIYDPNGDEAGYTVLAEIEGDPVAVDDIILV